MSKNDIYAQRRKNFKVITNDKPISKPINIGNIMIKCGVCGLESPLYSNIELPYAFQLDTSEAPGSVSEIGIYCTGCGCGLTLRATPGKTNKTS